ncbi:hypothetical protein AB0H98_30575 [Nocardia salmonicida]|uniref:hypothetical protein n=1 Tax=Nocardia salmonicida TaxID=53431 RepID=UPI0033E743D6
MRAKTFITAVVLLSVACLLLTDPQAVIGAFFFAAFVLVLWKMLTQRSGPLRRGGRR